MESETKQVLWPQDMGAAEKADFHGIIISPLWTCGGTNGTEFKEKQNTIRSRHTVRLTLIHCKNAS